MSRIDNDGSDIDLRALALWEQFRQRACQLEFMGFEYWFDRLGNGDQARLVRMYRDLSGVKDFVPLAYIYSYMRRNDGGDHGTADA